MFGAPFFARLKASATKPREPAKARTGNEVGRTAKNWGVRRVGTEAQAGLPVLLEKQRRHAGCARCLDGVHVHDARSGTACRTPTGRKLKAPAGRAGRHPAPRQTGRDVQTAPTALVWIGTHSAGVGLDVARVEMYIWILECTLGETYGARAGGGEESYGY